MEITLDQLAALTQGTILSGEKRLKLTGFGGLRESGRGDLSFYGNERYLNDLRRTRASAVLVTEGFPEEVQGVALIACANASAAFAEVVKRFMPPPREFRPGVHASAVVHPDARMNRERVCVGPCAVVEAGAEIGDGTEIGPGGVVGEHVRIGRDCLLHPRVTIYRHCVLGDRVRLHAGVVIGGDGFGYELVEGRHQKIDQVGIVQIDSDVEIGANTTVDRARFGRTWIGEGTKIDNHVMIAHNCIIGRHVIIVAQVGIAGSARVGDYTVIAAQAGIGGHIDVAPQVTIAGRAGVTRDIAQKGVYMGFPAQLMKEHQLQQVLVRKLPELFARVKRLEKGRESDGAHDADSRARKAVPMRAGQKNLLYAGDILCCSRRDMNFPTTRWSLIAAATLNDNPEGCDALNELCRRYRGPVLSFLKSKVGSPEDAEDLTQNLFRQILEKRTWLRADSAKGRFRSFLLTIATNAHRNWIRAACTGKRGGGVSAASLDLLDESGWEPHAPEDGAATRFDREWAGSVMAAAWRSVESMASASPEKAARFAVLRRFLPGKEAPPTYEAAAAELHIPADHVRTLIHRLRDDFRSALRQEVTDTLVTGDDLDDEMAHLCRVVAAGHDTESVNAPKS